MEFFNFLMNDVLSEPAVLVGLIALIGLIAQKKPVTECIKNHSGFYHSWSWCWPCGEFAR
ncbi:putative integral membrane protein [Vibrio cholerae]|nr:putative integral membrane protein [Vibrio cholerae]